MPIINDKVSQVKFRPDDAKLWQVLLEGQTAKAVTKSVF